MSLSVPESPDSFGFFDTPRFRPKLSPVWTRSIAPNRILLSRNPNLWNTMRLSPHSQFDGSADQRLPGLSQFFSVFLTFSHFLSLSDAFYGSFFCATPPQTQQTGLFHSAIDESGHHWATPEAERRQALPSYFKPNQSKSK